MDSGIVSRVLSVAVFVVGLTGPCAAAGESGFAVAATAGPAAPGPDLFAQCASEVCAGDGTCQPSAAGQPQEAVTLGARLAIQEGNLLIPNENLNGVQEFDPITRTVVQLIPLPHPYSYQHGNRMLWSAAVRAEDHSIILNVRDTSGVATVIALSNTGQLLSAQPVGSDFLQELALDPLDPGQHRVLGGVPFAPRVDSVDAFSGSVAPRIVESSLNAIGIEVDAGGDILISDWNTARILRYESSGAPVGTFANVGSDIGRMPHSLTSDGAGNVYAAAYDLVVKYSQAGAFIGSITNPHFTEVTKAFFDQVDDLLYVSNQTDDLLYILTADGVEVAVVQLGGGGNTGNPVRVPQNTSQIFADGFETGTTTQWSNVFPG